MENEKQQLEALQDIRRMMKDSSKFLSLSGLSGVFAGIYALAGAWLGHRLVLQFELSAPAGSAYDTERNSYETLLLHIVLICAAVLFLSLITAFYLSNRKAQKNDQKLFDHTSKKLLWHMSLPLFTGGLFCIALLWHGNGMVLLISPAMLLFYGLALVNSSKFTLHDIRYLGYLELALGILASFFLRHGLLFWALGFGLLHIIYGAIMWFKYDRIN